MCLQQISVILSIVLFATYEDGIVLFFNFGGSFGEIKALQSRKTSGREMGWEQFPVEGAESANAQCKSSIYFTSKSKRKTFSMLTVKDHKLI